MTTLSILVPVYQNAADITTTVEAILGLEARLPDAEIELVLVDDGSTDGSRELVRTMAANNPKVRGLLLTRNFGQTAAIQAGLRHATGDCIGIISCDLQENPAMFLAMYEAWRGGARFVLGERVARAEGKGHQAVSSVYWRLVRRFAFPDFPVMGYDSCLLDRQVAEDINRINEKNSSIFVLIYWLGYRPYRVPVHRENRRRGRSQWRWAKKISFTVDTMIGFSRLPSRAITFSALSVAGLSLCYLGVVVLQWYWLRAAPPGWATLAGLILLLGAVGLFALGIISEYLCRILEEVRKRPPFIVEAVVVAGANRKGTGVINKNPAPVTEPGRDS